MCLVVRQHPNREIDFDCACVCVACVRAKLRVRDVSAVAGGGLVEKPGRPALPPAAAGPCPCPRRRKTTPLFGVGLLDRVGKCLEVFESV